MRTLRIALASLLLVAGCSTVEAGEPRVAGGPGQGTGATQEPTRTSATPGTSGGSTPGDRPRRPKDIDLTKVDICRVLKKVPRRTYGIDDDRPPVGGTSQIFPGAKDCFSEGFHTNLALTLIAVTDRDARDFVSTADAEVSDFDAQGYPLSVLRPDSALTHCFGVLDVHDGQFIWIAYGNGIATRKPITPMSRLCETVPRIAASAIAAIG